MQHFGESQLTHPMFASLRALDPPELCTPEMTIAAMDEGRVSMGLAAAWCGPEGWMISNDDVAAFMQAYPIPNRILGAASANLLASLAAVPEFRRAVKALGFRALRLVPWLWNLPPND